MIPPVLPTLITVDSKMFYLPTWESLLLYIQDLFNVECWSKCVVVDTFEPDGGKLLE